MKKTRRLLATILVVFTLTGAFCVFWLAPKHTVPILMYHRFGKQEGSLFVTPENFKRQMDYLDNAGYKVISLDEFVDGLKAGHKFDRRTVVITIDDGYKDNYVYAYPILKKLKYPATIFLVAGDIGEDPDFIDWDEARLMQQNGISFGAHTVTNTYIPGIKDPKKLEYEIAESKRIIEDNLKKPVRFFCYPTGGFTEEAKSILKKSGYDAACTTNRGMSRLNRDPFELKRVKVTNSDTTKPLHFWAKLSGYYNLFRSLKEGG